MTMNDTLCFLSLFSPPPIDVCIHSTHTRLFLYRHESGRYCITNEAAPYLGFFFFFFFFQIATKAKPKETGHFSLSLCVKPHTQSVRTYVCSFLQKTVVRLCPFLAAIRPVFLSRLAAAAAAAAHTHSNLSLAPCSCCCYRRISFFLSDSKPTAIP